MHPNEVSFLVTFITFHSTTGSFITVQCDSVQLPQRALWERCLSVDAALPYIHNNFPFQGEICASICFGHGCCQVVCARESRPLALTWEMESGAAMLKQCSLGNWPPPTPANQPFQSGKKRLGSEKDNSKTNGRPLPFFILLHFLTDHSPQTSVFTLCQYTTFSQKLNLWFNGFTKMFKLTRVNLNKYRRLQSRDILLFPFPNENKKKKKTAFICCASVILSLKDKPKTPFAEQWRVKSWLFISFTYRWQHSA